MPEASTDARVADAPVIGLSPCNGEPPVMKARNMDSNTEFDPDWTCYDGSDGGAPVTDAVPPPTAPRRSAGLPRREVASAPMRFIARDPHCECAAVYLARRSAGLRGWRTLRAARSDVAR